MSSASEKQIKETITRINEAWVRGETGRLHEYFHEDIVIVHPGFARHERGRDACVASYIEFARQAVVQDYKETDVVVDVWGDTAVASYRFEIDYEMGGQRYHDTGHDLFVFAREGDRWLAVWRTLLPSQ